MKKTPSGVLLAAFLVLAGVMLVPPVSAEITQKRGVRVSVQGELAPKRLPRHGAAPVAVSVAGKIGAAGPYGPPQLRTLTIAINRYGHLSDRGLPRCRLGQIDPSTTAQAMAACGSSLVGEGRFSADVKLPEQSPFPSDGKVLAFNGRLGGRPAIFAHIYGTKPVPTAYVLPFMVTNTGGTFGTVLEASLPQVTGDWGFVTGISIELDRTFTYRGERRSFLTASCPAPRGFDKVAFPLMRTNFSFDGGLSLTSVLTRTCQAAG